MDNEKIKDLATVLGIKPERLAAALELINEGEEVQEVEEDPRGTLDNFYFNPNVFMKLHSIDCKGLRKLVVPDLRRLRR